MTNATQINTLEPIRWNKEKQLVEVIEQRLLPYELKWVEIKTVKEAAVAIKDMVVRGAPLIGITAAYGMAFAAREAMDLNEADKLLRSTRPTAVNLMWALDQIWVKISQLLRYSDPSQSSLTQKSTPVVQDLKALYLKNFDASSPVFSNDLFVGILEKAHFIHKDDIERCKKMSQLGADYILEKFRIAAGGGFRRGLFVMTHCNAGALATGGYGTALGVIRKLHELGCIEMVYSNETRPRQQGSRLTAWELAHDNIPVTMLADTMAAHLMKQGKIDLVITGADRITANGDAANKIGTYQVAIAAQYHQIPFFVAAPHSTIDMSLSSGDLIEIEQRPADEVSHINGKTCTAAQGVSVENPAFDVTPNALIEAIFTEQGLFEKNT